MSMTYNHHEIDLITDGRYRVHGLDENEPSAFPDLDEAKAAIDKYEKARDEKPRTPVLIFSRAEDKYIKALAGKGSRYSVWLSFSENGHKVRETRSYNNVFLDTEANRVALAEYFRLQKNREKIERRMDTLLKQIKNLPRPKEDR